MSKKIRFSWVWIPILIIGVFIGYCIKKVPFVELDNTIDLAEVLNILIALVTLGVAGYIAHVLERRKKKEEYIFEFLIQKVNDIKKNIQSLTTTLNNENIPIYIVNSKLKDITLSYLDLKNIMETVQLSPSEKFNTEIMKHIKHLKLLCTENSVYKYGTNVIAYEDELGITIENSKLDYSTKRKDEISRFTKQLINKIFHLVIE